MPNVEKVGQIIELPNRPLLYHEWFTPRYHPRVSGKHVHAFGYKDLIEDAYLYDYCDYHGLFKGCKNEASKSFVVDKLKMEIYKGRETYAEYQKRTRVASAPPTSVLVSFNKEELEEILEKFNGSNHELGQVIYTKALAALSKFENKD